MAARTVIESLSGAVLSISASNPATYDLGGFGALGWTALYDVLLRATEWWRLLLGLTILALILAFPEGIGGIAARLRREASQ